MQKAKIIKYCLCACLTCAASSPLLAQEVLGQIIELTKKNKLNELMSPAPAPASGSLSGRASAALGGMPAFSVGADTASKISSPLPIKAAPMSPVLWSINGVNSELMAEVWIDSVMHQVMVVPGQKLPGGWEVLEGNSDFLTLGRKKARLTLTPAAKGSMGGEFSNMKSASMMGNSAMGSSDFNRSPMVVTPMASNRNELNPAEFDKFVSNKAVNDDPSVVNAREAANRLPVAVK